jgi:hypothetical protein
MGCSFFFFFFFGDRILRTICPGLASNLTPSACLSFKDWSSVKIYFQTGCLVIHPCNPSYSGGRDQEDRGSKPARTNSSRDPVLKKPFTKKGWWGNSRHRPRVQTLNTARKKKKRKRFISTAAHVEEEEL